MEQRLEGCTLPDYRPTRNARNNWGFDIDEQLSLTYTGMGLDINVHDQWAVESMGAIQDRTEEHLGVSDKAITAYERAIALGVLLLAAIGMALFVAGARRIGGHRLAVLALVAVGGWILSRGSEGSAPTMPLVFAVHPPPGGSFTPTAGSRQTAQLAVAPDGQSLAFIATGIYGKPLAKQHGALLLELSSSEALVCLREGARPQALAELRRVLGVPLRVTAVERTEVFERRLAEVYTRANQSAAFVADNLEQDMDLSRLVQEMPKTEDLLDSEDDAPIIRMINVLLTQALRQGASDIHIEPYEARSAVRFRLDGTLHTVAEPDRVHPAMVDRRPGVHRHRVRIVEELRARRGDLMRISGRMPNAAPIPIMRIEFP